MENMEISPLHKKFFIKYIEKLIKELYGTLTIKKGDSSDDYHFYNESGESVFYKNSWGRLWIGDYDFFKLFHKFSRVLGIDVRLSIDIIGEYFRDKYNIKIKDVAEPEGYWFEEY
jgi:hypothetical protein